MEGPDKASDEASDSLYERIVAPSPVPENQELNGAAASQLIADELAGLASRSNSVQISELAKVAQRTADYVREWSGTDEEEAAMGPDERELRYTQALEEATRDLYVVALADQITEEAASDKD